MRKDSAKGSGCVISVVTGCLATLLVVLMAPQVTAGLLPLNQTGNTNSSSPQQPSLSNITNRTSGAEPRIYRLPHDLQPFHYYLELAPDIYGNDSATFSFQGQVNITVRCVSPTRQVILNAKNLSVARGDVTVKGSSVEPQVVDMEVDDSYEILNISLDQELVKGETYEVQIAFSGPLTDDLSGLYLSEYKRGNQTVYLATTQFEPADAREAFPCFDEPAFKANFSITLVRKPPLISLSNTRITHTLPRADGWVADVYDVTPLMSTYLLAFVICDFVNVTGVTAKGTQFGVWARAEFADSMDYALQTGMTLLDFFGDLFGTNFPLEKQDMIAIPNFRAGAMENWGLITYREKRLLYHENLTSEEERQSITAVIAHELGHQWFGNLVTMAWWDDLWLNEGFAEFVEYIGADKIEPRWKMWELFVINTLQRALRYDQTPSSHPLYHRSEGLASFDTISYQKGASVIRMIQFCLGDGTFHRGLQRYLKQHEYDNANHTNLWKALAEQTREENKSLNIPDIMNTWTLQMGYPVINVTRNSQGDVTVSQKHFLINSDAEDPGVFPTKYGYQWHVPLTMTSSAQPQFNVSEDNVHWLSKNEASKTLTPWVPMPDYDDPEGWFLVNVQQMGYYRVNYDRRNWDALIDQLLDNHTVISPINRAQIIDDSGILASGEELPVEVSLNVLKYLEQEEHYVPWAAAATQLNRLKACLFNTSGLGALHEFVQNITRDLYIKLGLSDTGTSPLETFTRSTVIDLACKFHLKECKNDSLQQFRQWRQNPSENPISPTVREVVYCSAVKEGNEDDWLFVLARFRQEQAPAEKTHLRKALACTRIPHLLDRLLNMSIMGKHIKRDDANYVVAGVSANDVGHKLAWDFVRENWESVLDMFDQSSKHLGEMISAITSSFRTESAVKEVEQFISEHTGFQDQKTLLRKIEGKIKFNMKWHRDCYQSIVQWLTNNGFKDESDPILTITESK